MVNMVTTGLAGLSGFQQQLDANRLGYIPQAHAHNYEFAGFHICNNNDWAVLTCPCGDVKFLPFPNPTPSAFEELAKSDARVQANTGKTFHWEGTRVPKKKRKPRKES